MTTKPPVTPTIETIGKAHSLISVEISTRFLQHFSEQLYSSPQKAFEELISNGWDAGADRVDVRISPDLKTNPKATMVVLDNGTSMNEEGLRQLWHIAFSPKSTKPTEYGRSIIGKFGIGKLATYVLANKLTYICKAKDGQIRRVTMDYAEIDLKVGNPASGDKLIRDVKLEVFDVDENEVELALKSVYGGTEILAIIKNTSATAAPVFDDEYGAMKQTLKRDESGTWTLVVLSDLKDTGKELKLGVLKRMLAAALPFGSEMAITINDAQLASPQLDTPKIEEWTVGPELKIDSLDLEAPEEDAPQAAKPKTPAEKIELKASAKPVPHIDIPGIGMVTGRVSLFTDPITGGKSEQRGASNGYHINVLGRLINQDSPSFGENSLNHAAWSRFRMTIRADGLSKFLTTDRERFKDAPEVRVFKEFLHRAFNKARSAYDSDESAMMPHGGDALVKSLGVVSLNPLRSFVDTTLASHAPIPGMIDDSGITDRQKTRKEWKSSTAENIGTH
jgi:hypothetical protein